MLVQGKLKQWGSSLGLVVPRDVVVDEHLSVGDEVIVEIKKKHNLHEIFGSLAGWKVDPQKIKDDSRRAWAK